MMSEEENHGGMTPCGYFIRANFLFELLLTVLKAVTVSHDSIPTMFSSFFY